MQTISEQLNLVRDALAAWARGYSAAGAAVVAPDPWAFWDILASGPNAVRAVVWLPSEDTRGDDFPSLLLCERRFNVVITRPKSPTLQKNKGLSEPVAGIPPLFDLVESARDHLRGLAFELGTTELYPIYLGFEILVTPDGVPLDAYQLKFKLTCELPQPSTPDHS